MNGFSPGIELDAEPACENIFNGGGQFLAYAVNDLCLNRRTAGKNGLREITILESELQHFPCVRSEFGSQVLRSLLRKGIDAHHLFPEVNRESFSTVKDMRSCRRFRDGKPQSFLDGIDGVLCHGAMRGPFPAHDAD